MREPAATITGVNVYLRPPRLSDAGAFDARDQSTIRRPRENAAGFFDQRFAGVAREVVPQRIGAADEGHVARILEVRLADHARFPVRGSEGVGW